MKKEVKISLAAIVAIILLFIGINFLKGINVFQSSNTYYVKFADIGGLSVSNPVYANGYPVGIVRTIDYDYQQGRHVVVGIMPDIYDIVYVKTDGYSASSNPVIAEEVERINRMMFMRPMEGLLSYLMH